jgi:uncharacterized membrane protein YeiH
VLLYYLDLAGVAVFAASGVLAARDKDLDLLGVIVVAAITAIGGGTLRDLLLNRHPIFWVTDVWYLIVIIASALMTVAYVRVRPTPVAALLVADVFGLALFALSGARFAEAAQHPPLILRREIYATAAIVGVAAYLALQALGMPGEIAFGAGMLVVVALRLLAIRWGLHLPLLRRL